MTQRILAAIQAVEAPIRWRHLCALTAVTSVLLLATVPHAGAAGTNPKHGGHKRAAQTRSTQQTQHCATRNCTATRAIFNKLKMICPTAMHGTCTYYIHVQTQAQVSALDAGLFRFLVDGNPPPSGSGIGGTDQNGYIRWVNTDPDSGIIKTDARSYAVVAEVTNDTLVNQPHTIEVFIGCTDTDSSGSCSVTSGLSSQTVDVYTPSP